MEVKKVVCSLLNLDEYLTNCCLYPFSFCLHKFHRKSINIASNKCFSSLDDHYHHSKSYSVSARWLMRFFIIWAASKFKISVWFPIGYFSFGFLVSFCNKGVAKKVKKLPKRPISVTPAIVAEANKFDQSLDELKRGMLAKKTEVERFWKDLTRLVEEDDFVDRIFKELFVFYFNLLRNESKFDNHLEFFLSNLSIDDRKGEKIVNSIKTIRNEMVQELKRPPSHDVLHGYKSISLNDCLHRNIPKKYWPFPSAKTVDKKNKNTFVCYVVMILAIYYLSQNETYYLSEKHEMFSPLNNEELHGEVYSYPFKLLLKSFNDKMKNFSSDCFENSQYYSYIAKDVPITTEPLDGNNDGNFSTDSPNDCLEYVLDVGN